MVRIHWGALILDEGRADDTQGPLDVTHNERRFDPNDPITSALERRITAGVSCRALGVIGAIDLNHEPVHELRPCAFGVTADGRPRADFAALDSLLVWSAGCDMLRDEAAALASRARETQLHVEYRQLSGLSHDFPLFAGRVPEAEAALTQIGERLQQWFRQDDPSCSAFTEKRAR